MKSRLETLLRRIIQVILDYKSVEKIVLFGSRASVDYKETSDIDIAILGKDWSDTDINIIKYTLDEEVKTPLKFDLVNFYTLNKDKLRENILKKGKIIYDSGKD